jgi:hypothetical protein
MCEVPYMGSKWKEGKITFESRHNEIVIVNCVCQFDWSTEC